MTGRQSGVDLFDLRLRAPTSVGTEVARDGVFTVTLDPAGGFAYVTTDFGFLVYAVNPGTGALALQSTVPTRYGEVVLVP